MKMVENTHDEKIVVRQEDIGDIVAKHLIKKAEKDIETLLKDEDPVYELMSQSCSIYYANEQDNTCNHIYDCLQLGEVDEKLIKLYVNKAKLMMKDSDDFESIETYIKYSTSSSEDFSYCIIKAAETFSVNELKALLEKDFCLKDGFKYLAQEDTAKTMRNLLRIIAELRKDTKNVE